MEGEVKMPLAQTLEILEENKTLKVQLKALQNQIDDSVAKVSKAYRSGLTKFFNGAGDYSEGKKHFEVRFHDAQDGLIPKEIQIVGEEDKLLSRSILHFKFKYGS